MTHRKKKHQSGKARGPDDHNPLAGTAVWIDIDMMQANPGAFKQWAELAKEHIIHVRDSDQFAPVFWVANGPDEGDRHELPKGAILDFLLPTDRAEDAIYNLLGRFPSWVEKYGERRARRMFLTHSLGTVVGHWIDWVLKRWKLIKAAR